jgi:hypothetical protein
MFLHQVIYYVPVVDGVLHLAIEVVYDVEGLLVWEERCEAREEDGWRIMRARRELERDDRMREVVVLLRVTHRRVRLKVERKED